MQLQMKSLHHLLNLNYTSPFPSFLLLHPQSPLPTYSSLSPNPNLSSTRQVSVHCRRRWDSRAETFRSRNYNSKPRKDEDDYEQFQRWCEAADQLIDDIWIFKVFKSYGLMLPGIILSFLLATGPKAFLMTLAIPLGQSVITLALESIWGRKRDSSKPKAKARKKPPGARTRTSRKLESEEENKENPAEKKKKTDYESWVAGNSGPVKNISEDGPTFGGWDELDRRAKFDTIPTRKTVDETQRTRKSKMSRREGKSDGALLLRLMVAVFPFLGSWIKML